jgi:hypothetical protein
MGVSEGDDVMGALVGARYEGTMDGAVLGAAVITGFFVGGATGA